ncbi:hypothetical protein BCR33DRAFT_722283 [Rhizoclosmatium globosum]|uniref:Uncharacterized protein n=1 Tax=Rhizoclosmatium globosum TaxID=329046 RepID=A0A1Y2BN49_9FUNG|nr:hypothetical protein BCR33DRAFT_722283 [Rhizoclosmatium globosum]|eukprot:ORY36181.1 hypothetical protein BCR33DRAFT_722283 [Rhizoclosmatium globosum]
MTAATTHSLLLHLQEKLHDQGYDADPPDDLQQIFDFAATSSSLSQSLSLFRRLSATPVQAPLPDPSVKDLKNDKDQEPPLANQWPPQMPLTRAISMRAFEPFAAFSIGSTDGSRSTSPKHSAGTHRTRRHSVSNNLNPNTHRLGPGTAPIKSKSTSRTASSIIPDVEADHLDQESVSNTIPTTAPSNQTPSAQQPQDSPSPLPDDPTTVSTSPPLTPSQETTPPPSSFYPLAQINPPLDLAQLQLVDSLENMNAQVAAAQLLQLQQQQDQLLQSQQRPNTPKKVQISEKPPLPAHANTRPTTAKRSKMLAEIRVTAQEFLEYASKETTPTPKRVPKTFKRFSTSINQSRRSAAVPLRPATTATIPTTSHQLSPPEIQEPKRTRPASSSSISRPQTTFSLLRPIQEPPRPSTSIAFAEATGGRFSITRPSTTFPVASSHPSTSAITSTSLPPSTLDLTEPATTQPPIHPLYNRPIVPHDYGNPNLLGTHTSRCQHLPHGTILSHLAKSPRNRRSTFGTSNRIAFLSAMGLAERGPGVALTINTCGAKRDRAVRRFWPEVEPADAVGLTLCGSASEVERILRSCCTYGKERDESKMPPIPESDFTAARPIRPKDRVPPIPQTSTTLSQEQLCRIAMQFQDVLSSENRPLCEISQVMHLAIPQDPPGKLQVNTRYSANSQWFHRTNHVGLPETDQVKSFLVLIRFNKLYSN